MAEDSACRRWDESPPPSLEEEKEGEDDSYGAKANGESEGPRDELHYSVLRYDKSGDDFVFHVQVKVNGKEKLVRRSYRDLLWLHRNLSRRVELGGHILPPMPAPPCSKELYPTAEATGDRVRTFYGDATRLPCLAIEVFLQAMADHRFFSENHTVHTYLTSNELYQQESLGAGSLWNHLTKALTDYQLTSVEETDEVFSTELKHADTILPLLNTASQNFGACFSASQALECACVVMESTLRAFTDFQEGSNSEFSKLLVVMTDLMEEHKGFLHAASLDGRHSLGFFLDYHGSCYHQMKAMLYRRLERVQSLLKCTRQVERAKPDRKQAAEAARLEADRALNRASDIAKEELKLFKSQRTHEMHSCLVDYTEAQLEHSRQSLEALVALKERLLSENSDSY